MDDDARAQILARAQARKPKRTRKPRRSKPSAKTETLTPSGGEAPASPRSRRSRHAWDGHGSAVQEEARKAVPVAGPGVGAGPPHSGTPAAPPAPPVVAPRRRPDPVGPTPLPTVAPRRDLPPLVPLAASTTTQGYWNDDFAVLYDYVTIHGAAIPRSGQVWNERPVGRWVEQQRRRRDRLSAAQTAALEALPGWCWSSVDAVWEEHLRALQDWVDARGWLPPPTLRLANGLRIGPWMEHQRRLHREERLSATRAARLEALPAWTWHRNA